MAAAAASTSLSLKEYLKKYENPSEDDNKSKAKKKRKKSKQNKASVIGGVRVVDEDPVWQKPVELEEEDEDDESHDEKPQINEDIEVKRMKRLEEIRSRRPYHAISDDGSGWVPISDPPNHLDSGDGVHDISPPRKRRPRFDTPSPEPESKPSSGKIPNPNPNPNPSESLSPDRHSSPPRRSHSRMEFSDLQTKNSERPDSPELSPPRRSRTSVVSSDFEKRNLERPSTISLDFGKRNLEKPNSPDHSPRRRNRPISPDLSPPRRNRPVSPDFSPPRRNRPISPDLSPPRRNRPVSPDFSPPRRSRPSTMSLDLERKNSDGVHSLDLSPPRRSRPPAVPSGVKRKNSGRNNSPDLSLPRSSRHYSPEAVASHATPAGDLSPPRKNRNDLSGMKAGRKAGLVSPEEIKEEINKKKKEELRRISEMDPSISGRGSENVYREQGRRISKDEFLKLKRGEEKPKEKKLEWGKGLAQKREAEARELELELEKDKPFARSRDDPELDKMLKDRVRWGDPMAHLVKRKQPELMLEDLGGNEKMKESGFLIPQTIPNHSWLKRGIDAPGNRYGIRPGRHWDGVDRSNGTEKEMFKRQNEKKATEREAYLWSVSDM